MTAPLLRLIEGDEGVATVPGLPPVRQDDRLFPVFETRQVAALLRAAALSLAVHTVVFAAAYDWAFLGEERAAGGSEEEIVIDGVDVVLLDQTASLPSPLVEAPQIETIETVAPVADTQLAAIDAAPTEIVRQATEPTPPESLQPETAELEGRAIDEVVALSPQDEVRQAEAPKAEVAADEHIAPLPPAEAPRVDDELVTPSPLEVIREETDTVKPDGEALATAPAGDEVSPVEETLAVVAAEVAPPIPPKKPADFAKAVEAAKAKPVKKAESPAKKRATASASKARPAAAPSEAKQVARSPDKGKAGARGRNRAAAGKAQLSSYQSKLVSHLRRYRTYPDAARRQRIRGTAVVNFTIDSNGRVVGSSLARSAGHAILDREALAMVRRASPFPAMPSGIGQSRMTVQAPIRFDMR